MIKNLWWTIIHFYFLSSVQPCANHQSIHGMQLYLIGSACVRDILALISIFLLQYMLHCWNAGPLLVPLGISLYGHQTQLGVSTEHHFTGAFLLYSMHCRHHCCQLSLYVGPEHTTLSYWSWLDFSTPHPHLRVY